MRMMMVMRTLAFGLFAITTLPRDLAVAQDATWQHEASGIQFPEQLGEQRIVQRQDISSPFDSVVNYEATAGVESITIYIFRASPPSVPLWFERARPVVESQIPLAIFDGGETEQVNGFGSASANGLRRVYETNNSQGPFRVTSLTIVQAGPWLLKIRSTSSTLDRAGLEQRIESHLDAITLPENLSSAAILELAPPPACVGNAPPESAANPIELTDRAPAAAMGLFVFAEMHNSNLPLNNRFCLVSTSTNVAGETLLMRMTADLGGWVSLLGDAGRAVTTVPLEPGGASDTYVLIISNPQAVTGVGLFDGNPSPAQALAAAVPVLSRQSQGLFQVGAEPA